MICLTLFLVVLVSYLFSSTQSEPILAQTLYPNGNTSAIGVQFGKSLKFDNSTLTLLIGAPGENAAYFFKYNSKSKEWKQNQRVSITSKDAVGFGSSLTIDNNYAAIGDTSKFGCIYIYKSDDSSSDWENIIELNLPSQFSNPNTQYIFAVGASTNKLLSLGYTVIATVSHRSYLSAGGFVLIYSENTNFADPFVLKPKELSEKGSNKYGLGNVAINGNTIIVSDSSGNDYKGLIYIYEYSNNNKWEEVTILYPSNGLGGDYFGITFSFDGINLAVGESYNNPVSVWNRIIPNNNKEWKEIKNISVPNDINYPWSTSSGTTFFATQISISNDKLIILLTNTNAADCSSTSCFGRMFYDNYNLSYYSFNYNNYNIPYGQDIINDYFVVGNDNSENKTSNVQIYKL